MRTVLVSLFALGLLACGNHPGDDTSGDDSAMLVVTPGDTTVTVVNGAAVMQPYTASLVAADGSSTDVTADVSWTIDSTSIGYFDQATLIAQGPGRATITAIQGDKRGTAVIEVFTQETRVGDGAPANAGDLFDGATDDPSRVASIVYPAPSTIFPPNLGAFDLHWIDQSGSDLFELRLSTYYADVRVYLGADANAGAWIQFLENEWFSVATSEIGATIDVSVRGLTQATPTTSSHATIQVSTSRENIEGGIYYWAAAGSSPEGIYRHDMGHPDQAPEQFYTTMQTPLDANGNHRCVACHALSRDGTKMALTYDGGNGWAETLDVATRATMMPLDNQAWNFATFTPDGNKVLTVSNGVFSVRDPQTGVVFATPNLGGYSTHPDISAQGDKIVYVRPAGIGSDWGFTGGSLIAAPYDSGANTIGTETAIVPSAGENNYYPSFSPDGQWVLFNRSNEDAYNDASAELWVVKADGSQPPIKLDLANIGPNLTNSWARWAPFDATYGDSSEPIYWLTFSSKRDFGVRLVGVGRPQIWMTPFFPSRAAAGQDPTAPGFWLPFQDIQTSNHIAQWTETVVPIN